MHLIYKVIILIASCCPIYLSFCPEIIAEETSLPILEMKFEGYEEDLNQRWEVEYIFLNISTKVLAGRTDELLEETFQGKWKISYEYKDCLEQWGCRPASYTVYTYNKKTRTCDNKILKYTKREYDVRKGEIYYEVDGKNKTITHLQGEFDIKSALFSMHLAKQLKLFSQ